jgi:hypothetical protein
MGCWAAARLKRPLGAVAALVRSTVLRFFFLHVIPRPGFMNEDVDPGHGHAA